MTFVSQKLRDASNGQSCVRCGRLQNVVGCHYTGARRLSYGGGYGKKVHDFMLADLCDQCHVHMDQRQRAVEGKDGVKEFLHSEEFLHLIALTLERRFVQGVIGVKGQREPRIETLAKIVPRRSYVGRDTRLAQDPPIEAPTPALPRGTLDLDDAARVGPEAHAAAAEAKR